MPVDFVEGSITTDFAKRPPATGTETFERYHVEDLAGGGTYTPADEGLFSAVLESEDMNVELQTGQPAWEELFHPDDVWGNTSVIGDGTNMRFNNDNVAARELVVMRHHISPGTYERYHTADLAAATTYTPVDEGLFSHASHGCYIDAEYHNAAWYGWGEFPAPVSSGCGTLLAIGDGTNLRYHNPDGANDWWVVIMRALMPA